MAFGAFVQIKHATGADTNIVLPSAPTVGNVLFYVFNGRTNPTAAIPPGTGTWTFIRKDLSDPTGYSNALFYRIVQLGDTATWLFGGGTSDDGTMAEFQGPFSGAILDADVGRENVYVSGPTSLPSPECLVDITPTPGVPVLLVSAAVARFDSGTATGFPASPATGMTNIYGGALNQVGPSLDLNYRVVNPSSGTYRVGTTGWSTPYQTQAVSAAAFIGAPRPGDVVVDWDDDGFDLGDDVISLDVMSWVISRGASAEITGGASPGGATILVRRKERDGLYNPWYTAGPLYGKLRDGRRVHIAINADGTLGGSGTAIGLFAGRITDITPLGSEGPAHVPITEIVCEDPLAWYGRTDVHIADSRSRSHRELRLAVLAAIGETRYNLDSEIGTMPLSSADGDAFGVLQRINAANGTRHFAKPSNMASNWYRYTTRNRNDKTVMGVADASLDAGSDHVTDTSGWRLSADTVINQQRATVEPLRFPDRRITVWEPDALPIYVTTTMQTIWATFDDYVDRAVLDISSTGSAVTTTFTPFGRSAKITFVSAGVSNIRRLLVLGHLVERGTAVSVVIDDTASQAAPRGVRAGQEISGDYVGVKAMAGGIASHMVWRYGTPQMRPTLTVHNWFPEQFELDLYDLISFTADQFAASNVLFEIVGLTHTSDVAATTVQHHTTTYVLQECRVQSDPGWFVLDTSQLDSSDILGY